MLRPFLIYKQSAWTLFANNICKHFVLLIGKQLSENCPEDLPWQLISKPAGLWSIQILNECCSGCGAWYVSQKTSDIKRNNGEVWCKLSEARSLQISLQVFKKYTPTWLTKTTQLSRSVEQLKDNLHLATSAWSIYVVWTGGIPQSIVYLLHSDRFIAY